MKTTQPDEDGNSEFDYVLVGGGLQSGLIALALMHHQPDARLAIVERDRRLAGNHTWSFHRTDLLDGSEAWVKPLLQHTWDRYDVQVGTTQRDVTLGYCTTSAEHFDTVIAAAVKSSPTAVLLTHADASEVEPHRVLLADGRALHADIVIDNRGPKAIDPQVYDGGFQKFWGFEIEVPADWPSDHPRIMDDRVDQSDGFRFFYTLPFSSRRVLVEDTRFSD